MLRSLIWVGAFILVCGAVTTLLRTVDRTFRSGSVAKPSISTTFPTPDAASPRITSNQLPIKPPPASAADQHWEAMKLLSEADVSQRHAIDLIESWNREIDPLRNGEGGDVVAVNKDLLRKLTYVFEKQRMEQHEVHFLGEQIGALQQRLEAAAGEDPPQALSAREMFEIRELHTNARRAQEAWHKAVDQARAIVLKAGFEVNPVTHPTLQQGIDMIKAEEVVEKLDQEIERGEEEPVVEEPHFPSFPEIDPELRAKALSTEVKSTLAPFLEPRNIQPSLAGRFSIKFSRTFAQQPMSLGKLMGIGALDESLIGLQKLALIGGNRKLPEPKWSIASQPNSWNEGDEEFLKKSQQMLRDYGAILVEEGLLSP